MNIPNEMRKSVLMVLFIMCTVMFGCKKVQLDIIDSSLSNLDTCFVENPESEYIAIIGDIQYYTKTMKGTALYERSLRWIDNQNKCTHKIKAVLQTGDMTDNNLEFQWQNFYNTTSLLSDDIPFISMLGNHDYTWDSNGKITSREDTFFNDYNIFDATQKILLSQFESGKLENAIYQLNIAGKVFGIIVLEFGPREVVLDWADRYVKANPAIKFILMNHEFLEKGGGIRTSNLQCKRLSYYSYTTPMQLWDKLISPNDNIVCVLCGHVGGLYALTEMPNDYGRVIPQIQHNIQGSDYRNDNWVMFWEFSQENDIVNVFIYNTNTRVYFNNSNPLFSIKL